MVSDDGGGDCGRTFPGHPGPIPKAPRDNISRKGISSLRLVCNRPLKGYMYIYYIYIYIYIYIHGNKYIMILEIQVGMPQGMLRGPKVRSSPIKKNIDPKPNE